MENGLNVNNDCLMKPEDDKPRSVTSHCHVSNTKFDYDSRNRLIAVLILCIAFVIIEVIGGILSNSTAVLTDAVHMGIDVTSFLISLTAMYLATKRPTSKLSFGYIRAEVLGALLSVLTIWLVTGILVYVAVERCINQTFVIKPTAMIVIASCGVVFNIIMFSVLHADICGSSSSHNGHSHGDNYEQLDDSNHNQSLVDRNMIKKQKSSKNLNVRAAIIHVIGDFVQSVGVLIAAIIIKINPKYKLADPICTFIFSLLVLLTTMTIMRDIVRVLMEGVPSNVNYSQIVDDLLQLPGVRNVHNLHIWSLSMQETALSIHIAVDADRDYLTVSNQAREMLRREHSISRTTIEIEPYDEHVMNSCEDCRRPGT